MHIQILYGVNGEREVVKIKIRIIICIVIFVLCLFLFKTIITMKFHSLFEPVHITEEWLKLHSPDGDYTILVDSVRTVSEFDLRRSNEYKLNIYVKKEKTENHRKYYFSTTDLSSHSLIFMTIVIPSKSKNSKHNNTQTIFNILILTTPVLSA